MSHNQAKERDADFSKLDEVQEEAAELLRASDADADSGAEDGAQSEQSAEAGESADQEVAVSGEELQKLRAEVIENRDKYLRALAETENVRKRALKERSELLKYQGDRIFIDILEVVDNLERALSDKEASLEKLREGVSLIQKLLVDTLTRWEVRGESSVDKPFDPKLHRALSQVPVADKPAGTVIAEMKKPYFYKDKVLRVGEVIVSTEVARPANESPENDGEDQVEK